MTTIGEYVRQSTDEELSGILLAWMVTVITLVGIDYQKLDLDVEYAEIYKYLQTPISNELINSFKIWQEPYSNLKS